MDIDYCLSNYYGDCENIRSAINKHGFNLSTRDAAIFWATYSDLYWAASWLSLPCKNSIYTAFLESKEEIRLFNKSFLADTEFFDSDLVVGI